MLEQRGGKLQVRKVISNSPAQHAGIQVGDEILSINDRKVGAYACRAGWSGIDHTSAIVLRRGAEVINLQVPTVALVSMVRSQSLVRSSDEDRPSFQLDAPFTFGLRWKEHPGYLEISQLLAGSPAEGAGLRVGDRIVSLDSVSLGTTYAVDVSRLRDGDLPTRVDIETADGGGRRQLTLYSRGISEILASPDQRKLAPQTERASLNGIPVPSALK